MLQDVNLTYVKGIPTFGGPAGATALVANGLTGATAPSRYVGATVSGPPVSGTFAVGDFVIDQTANVWVCTSAGSPGSWASPSQDLELLTEPTGATGATIPREIATGSSGTINSGTVYARAIGLRAGIPINNITLFNTATSQITQADLTHGWYVLCDKNMVVRAVSSDQINVAFFTSQNAGFTLSVAGSAYTTTYSGLYYIGVMLAISAGIMPTFAIGGNVSTGVAQKAPALYGTSSTGQTTPPTVGSSLSAVSFLTAFNFYAYTS